MPFIDSMAARYRKEVQSLIAVLESICFKGLTEKQLLSHLGAKLCKRIGLLWADEKTTEVC